MVANKGTFETIRDLVETGNIDQQNVDLLILGGMVDIKDEIDDLKNNFTRKDPSKEKYQFEINQKVEKMYPLYSAQIWAYMIFFGAIIAAIATNKIAITVVP